ncbi:hypothetical protein Aduo_017048 [Ancylostoma duodenale]
MAQPNLCGYLLPSDEVAQLQALGCNALSIRSIVRHICWTFFNVHEDIRYSQMPPNPLQASHAFATTCATTNAKFSEMLPAIPRREESDFVGFGAS